MFHSSKNSGSSVLEFGRHPTSSATLKCGVRAEPANEVADVRFRNLQALSFSKEIFGDGSIEMVPPYLLLSEANLGLGHLQSAEEFLSLANWSILKTPACSNAIRSQV